MVGWRLGVGGAGDEWFKLRGKCSRGGGGEL